MVENDVILGADNIAQYLFGSCDIAARRKIYNSPWLPVFRLGKHLAARKSALSDAFARRERERRGDAA